MFPSLLLLFAALSAPAGNSPDKFWLDAPAAAVDGAPAQSPPCIEGVLLDEDDASYHVRVVGGEIWLPKTQVKRVEKDRLTTERVERTERAEHEQRVAEAQRLAAERAAADQAAAATVPAETPVLDDVTAIAECVDEIAAPPAPVPPHYDPVIHALKVDPACSDYTLLRDLELAYQLTHDRSYLKLLRVMRRLR